MQQKTKLQSFFEEINGKTIALCGIGKSNLPLIEMFIGHGANVIACDKRNEEELLENATLAKEAGALLNLGENYLNNLDVDIVLRTPGMKFFTPELVELRKNNVVVTSEMEIFFDLCPCRIIAVTGSDGKTTTTTIISEILKKNGRRVHLGGNIGMPLLPTIESIESDDIAVVELSSFQLISMRKSPDIAVVTNIEPNHLDIHKDMQEYVDAKKNIILHQNAFGKTVLNLDNKRSNEFESFTRGLTEKFSLESDEMKFGAYLKKNGDIIMKAEKAETFLFNKTDIKIPGMHNVANYLAAICAVWNIVEKDDILHVAKTFAGVEHRAEFVREVNGVSYYNDSIASSPTRTASGTLSLYDKRIILIAGGYDKNLSYEKLGVIINSKVKKLILMGETSKKIENAVRDAKNFTNEIEIKHVENMEQAVELAAKISQPGDIVSMSPASASFDLYPNFDARGKHFKELVNSL